MGVSESKWRGKEVKEGRVEVNVEKGGKREEKIQHVDYLQ